MSRHPSAGFPAVGFEGATPILRLTDLPLGQWLDEEGVRWQAHEDGSWTKAD